jgi:hypothetical protein
MMLVEILLNGQIDFETRILVRLPPVADHRFTDVAEPAAVALIRFDLAEDLHPQLHQLGPLLVVPIVGRMQAVDQRRNQLVLRTWLRCGTFLRGDFVLV